MWEEFTQSIHNFTGDKEESGTASSRKEESNYHSDPKHPFSAKGTKREVFGMTIPNELINDVIRGADYYDAYLEKVRKPSSIPRGEEYLKTQRKDSGKRFAESFNECKPNLKGASPPVKWDKDEGQAEQPWYTMMKARAGPNLDEWRMNPTFSNCPSDEWVHTEAYPMYREAETNEFDEQVIPEEPVSSTGTLSSLQHLAKDFSFDISVIPPMTSPVIGPVPRPDSLNVHWPLPTTTTTTATTTTTTTLLLPPQPQQGPLDPILIKRMGELEEFIANLVEENQALETLKEVVISSVKHAMRAPFRALLKDLPTSYMKEILLRTACWRRTSDKGHANHRSPPQPTQPPPLPPSGASGASSTTGAFDSTQAPPPPPPSSSTHQGDQSTSTAAPSSSKTVASAEYSAWTTTDTWIKPSITTIPDDLYMDDETNADEQAYSSGDEVGRDHIPTASALKSTYALPYENSLLAQTEDMAMFMDWYCKRQGITHLTLQDLEGPAFEIVKVFHPDVIHLQFQMEECHKFLTDQVDDTILRYNVSKPLPLGGEPGHISIQPHFFFNKDLEYLRYGRKVGRPALSISKMKAAYYLNVGLEQLVPESISD
ncbi:hypothetical protein Tco_0778371 [Tanacetum coccineum]